MSEIEKKALALVNEVGDWYYDPDDFGEERRDVFKALCRAIKRHEAFAQEVSDAVEAHKSWLPIEFAKRSTLLDRFIIAKPVDPLVEAMADCGFGDSSNAADDIRAAMRARGYEWRKLGEGA